MRCFPRLLQNTVSTPKASDDECLHAYYNVLQQIVETWTGRRLLPTSKGEPIKIVESDGFIP